MGQVSRNEDAEIADLVTHIEALDAERRDEFAKAIWQLWGAFIAEFGGVDAFAEAEPTVRNGYLSQLDNSAQRLAPHATSVKGYLYMAVAAFRAYLTGWIVPPSEQRRALGDRVVSALDRGKSLEGTSGG
jgi:hypothetical protein